MDHNAEQPLPSAAPLGGGAVEGEPTGRRDVQPLGLAANAKAGFIQVLDRRGLDEPVDDVHEPLKPRQGGRGELHPEQIGHQLNQSVLGDELIVKQVEDPGGDPRPVLHRGRHPRGEGRLGRCPTLRAPTAVGAVLGDLQGLGLGQVEDLSGAVGRRRLRGQGRAATLAHCVG